MKKYLNEAILVLLGIILVITSAGWYIIGDHICVLKTQVNQLQIDTEADSKKLQSLQQEKAVLQAKIKRLSLRQTGMNPGIYAAHLKILIQATLTYFSVAPEELADWERLLLLTVVAESDKGRLLRQVKGPAKGIFQTEGATEKDVLAWLKNRRPIDYEKIKAIRVPAKLDLHEAEFNLAYSTALCYFIYKWRRANPLGKDVKSLAKMYKKLYNTPLGKANVDKVLAKLGEMKIKI